MFCFFRNGLINAPILVMKDELDTPAQVFFIYFYINLRIKPDDKTAGANTELGLGGEGRTQS